MLCEWGIQLEMALMKLVFTVGAFFVLLQGHGTGGVECRNLLRSFWSEVTTCRKHPADRGSPALFQ